MFDSLLAYMSCLHITGTRREGVDVPLIFRSPPVTARTIKRLEKMSESPNRNIRAAAGASYQSTDGILSRLSRDSDEGVRCAVARNPTCPSHILDALASDSSVLVRSHTAYNMNTPAATLDKLLVSDDEAVRNFSRAVQKSRMG